MVKRLLDPNSQKTHYVIDAANRKVRKVSYVKAENDEQIENDVLEFEDFDHKTPFCKLLRETSGHVRHRYSLYEKVWGHQREAIQRILNSANNDLFANLLQYIQDPLLDKLSVVYLGLSSNTANNLRVLEEFSSCVAGRSDGQHIRVVRLNSKACFNIKAAIREVVKQVVHGNTREVKGEEGVFFNQDEEDEDEEDEDEEPDKKDDDQEDDVGEAGEAGEADIAHDDQGDQFEGDGGRISYDFGIVEDWVMEYVKQTKCEGKFRIVVILEDSNGFSNEVLNQLIQLLCVYATKTPLKIVMGLSSKNVSGWINSNITSKLRTLISGCKLVAKENKDIGFQVINDILLQNEITPENPLLLDSQLSLIVLSRFENSNNSIDSLITELKFAYMTHFYQLPLSALVDPNFMPGDFHYDALRKLPSFKTHMEYLLHNYKQMTVGSEEWIKTNATIKSLLRSDSKLYSLFNEAKATFQSYQNAVMNAVNLIYFLGNGDKHRFQIYKLVTNNQLINSVFLSDVLKRLLTFSLSRVSDVIDFIKSDKIKILIGECTDTDIIMLREKLSDTTSDTVVEHITTYLHENKNLNMKISDNLFNEVLTINGGISELDLLKPSVTLEENYENLMINVIRPKLRQIIETGLDEPQKYLRNALLLEKSGQVRYSRLAGPVLTRLYHVYKDAPVNINIWDFYVAFKLSLMRHEIMKELRKGISQADSEVRQQLKDMVRSADDDDKEWDKLVYAWFLQSCFELTSMGFLREKSKGDYVEKMIWKNL